MTTPVELVLSKLPGAKRSGSGWLASCPAHDDQNPSLSINEGEDGRALFHCHAGCTPEGIVEALGLKMSDLMLTTGHKLLDCISHGTSKSQKPVTVYTTANKALEALEQRHRKWSAIWPYYDAENQLVGFVVRWNLPDSKKDLRPVSCNGQGWVIGAMPDPRPLYCRNELRESSRVYICEGEKAADAARSIGLTAVTSPGGSKAAAKTDWSPLASRECIILPDNDKPGEGYADAVGKILTELDTPATVKVVSLPGLPPGGDIYDWIEAHNITISPEGLSEIIEKLADTAPVWKPASEPWTDLVSFELLDLSEFPTHALPSVLRSWVEAVSIATQTPADLAALLALAACSSTIARKVVVEARLGWHEPVNLFVAVLLGPGNRKSAVFSETVKPLRELEAELIEDARPIVARELSERRQAEARQKRLEKLAAEGDMEARREAGDLAAELAMQSVPALPRLVVDDATEEKLGMMLGEQGGRIASMSPEGSVFDLMAGRYSKSGTPQFDLYLKGHSGDDLVTDRVGRESVRVTRPALTCAYAIQPGVVKRLAENKAFRDRGLLGRFLYAFPKSLIGQRTVSPPPVPDGVREAYRQTVRTMAERFMDTKSDSEPLVLSLSSDAEIVLRQWEVKIEETLDDGGAMEFMRDWGGKLAGATLRLAAVMHCMEHDAEKAIDTTTIKAAVEISQYLIPHAEAVLNLMHVTDDYSSEDAQYILRWIVRHGKRQFTKTEAQHHGKRHFPKAHDIDPGFAELARRGYIRPLSQQTSGPGRPQSPTYEVNPDFGFSNPRKRSQYSRNSSRALEANATEGSLGNKRSAFGESKNAIPDDGWGEV